jgi:hypothetical protein
MTRSDIRRWLQTYQELDSLPVHHKIDGERIYADHPLPVVVTTCAILRNLKNELQKHILSQPPFSLFLTLGPAMVARIVVVVVVVVGIGAERSL